MRGPTATPALRIAVTVGVGLATLAIPATNRTNAAPYTKQVVIGMSGCLGSVEGGDGYDDIRVVGYLRPVTTADGDSPRAVRSGSGWTPVDALFVIVAAGASVFYLVVAREFFMSGDDWRLLDQGLTFPGLFRPYNEHLSVVTLATYQGIARTFGLGSYLPFLILGVGSAVAVAITLFLIIRSRMGTAAALFVGTTMLFYPDLIIAVSAFNHYLAFTMIAVASWLLTLDDSKRDILIFLALTIAICSSGVAIAGIAGCLVYLLLTRAPWRRWLSVLVPLVGWLIWSAENPKTPTTSTIGGLNGAPSYVLRGLQSSFQGLAFNNQILGWCLAALFLTNLVRQSLKGPRAAAHELSWTAAAIAWWLGLATSRSWLTLNIDVFRYRFIGAGFLILASLPRVPITWTPQIPIRRTVTAGFALAALLALVLNIGGITRLAHSKTAFTKSIKITTAYLNLGPEYIPDNRNINFGFAFLTAGRYRNITAKFGRPDGTSPRSIDQFILGIRPPKVKALGPDTARSCYHLRNQVSAPPQPGGRPTVVLRTSSVPVTIRARMIGAAWIPVAALAPGRPSRLFLPATPLNRPWQLEVGPAAVCSR